MDLVAAGHIVRELTPYQFRIDGILDVFPTRKKFHNISANRRGLYDSISREVDKLLSLKPEEGEL